MTPIQRNDSELDASDVETVLGFAKLVVCNRATRLPAVDAREILGPDLELDPRWDSLRYHPGYQKLLEKYS